MTIEAENEVWAKVPNINYEASNLGRLRHIKTLKIKQSYDNGRGYRSFLSYTNGIKIQYVHRCILMAHNPCEGMENMDCNHKDFDRTNNKLSNLEWATRQVNLQYSRDRGKYKEANSNHSQWMRDNSLLKSMGWKKKGILAIQEMSILEFDSQVQCAKYFNTSPQVIFYHKGKEFQGHQLIAL